MLVVVHKWCFHGFGIVFEIELEKFFVRISEGNGL